MDTNNLTCELLTNASYQQWQSFHIQYEPYLSKQVIYCGIVEIFLIDKELHMVHAVNIL